MILVREAPLSGQILTLVKPTGKEIPFRLGEIVEGQVAEIFPSGGLTIKVKGGFLPVRTDLDFRKNEILFLKVVGQERKNGEVVLQLMDTKVKSGGVDLRSSPPETKGEDSTGKALDLISKLIAPRVEGGKVTSGQSLEIGKLRVVLAELLKSLPANMQSIPEGIKYQLQNVLQRSLQGLVPDIQDRILQIIKQLSGEIQYSPLIEKLKDILIPMDGLDSKSLKNILDNSGILLEAKLRALVGNEGIEAPNSNSNSSKLHNDLKAIILQLKENIQDKKDPGSSAGFFQKFIEKVAKTGETEPSLSPKVLGTLDSLVKDVETFQLISKISDSFHTFLPIQWNELKRGELIFKRRSPSKGKSFSCSIHLELEKLGPLSVFLFLQAGKFYINFKIDHPGLKEAVRSHRHELEERFLREGLNLQEVSIKDQGDRPTDPWVPVDSEETIVSIRI